MRKFPDINQFRHTVEAVEKRASYICMAEDGTPLFDTSRPKPVLTFRGTTKLHGTNGGVNFDLVNGPITAQARERELTLEEDNQGFCAWTQSVTGATALKLARSAVLGLWRDAEAQSVHLFGEYCGPSVNSKTAIGKLPERFVVFAVLVTDINEVEHWLDPRDVQAAYYALGGALVSTDFCFITEFKQFEITVDFNDPARSLALLETLTLEVEQSCPVASALGNPGGLGEGIVWELNHPTFGRLVFKTKGDKHKGTRGARLVTVAPEVLASREAFANAVLTDSRLEQGFELIAAQFGKVTQDRMGNFLQWVGHDVLKEESDTLKASGLDRKDVMGIINHRAKAWLTPRLALV